MFAVQIKPHFSLVKTFCRAALMYTTKIMCVENKYFIVLDYTIYE